MGRGLEVKVSEADSGWGVNETKSPLKSVRQQAIQFEIVKATQRRNLVHWKKCRRKKGVDRYKTDQGKKIRVSLQTKKNTQGEGSSGARGEKVTSQSQAEKVLEGVTDLL